MTTAIQAILFFLGMGVCVQIVGALFGWIDCRHALPAALPKVAGGILLWAAIAWIIGMAMNGGYQTAYVSGIAAYPVFLVGSYFGTKLFIRIRAAL